MSQIQSEELSIEEQYGTMSQIEHVLERSGMYIGSINVEFVSTQLYKPSINKIITVDNVGYIAGINKLVDEVITNCVDEFRKQKDKFGISEVYVDVNSNGTITIKDNGGIPIVEHKVTKLMLPKMLFGTLMSSGNYNKNVKRKGAGLNGLGAKLTNIFAKYFRVVSCDGNKQMDIQWSNNMRTVDHEIISKSKSNFTEISFQLELFRFEIDELSLDIIRIIQKRCIDASTNIGLTLNFTSNIGDGLLNSKWKCEKFTDFVDLHLEDTEIQKISQIKNNNTIVVLPSIGYNYGFVNGAVCKQGTHFSHIQKQISTKLLDVLKKEHNITLITSKDIENKISLFVDIALYNPVYDSQTKEKLNNKFDKDVSLILTKEFLLSLETSEILNDLVEYYKIKYLVEEKKSLKKLNNMLKTGKSTKLTTCAGTGKNNELWLFEGTSPANGFSKARDPQYQASYELRGKFKNTYGLPREKLILNTEIREILIAMNLRFEEPSHNIKNCPFDKVIIGTDADMDGQHITGLILAFFGTFFPELLKAGKIYGLMSPIIIASKKGNDEVFFYTIEEFNRQKLKYKSYDFEYIKGLGSLENHQYIPLIQNKRLIQFVADKEFSKSIQNWFSDEHADVRKELMLSDLT
jgi:DNA gyrase/topoisomerase IV subunit B